MLINQCFYCILTEKLIHIFSIRPNQYFSVMRSIVFFLPTGHQKRLHHRYEVADDNYHFFNIKVVIITDLGQRQKSA